MEGGGGDSVLFGLHGSLPCLECSVIRLCLFPKQPGKTGWIYPHFKGISLLAKRKQECLAKFIRVLSYTGLEWQGRLFEILCFYDVHVQLVMWKVFERKRKYGSRKNNSAPNWNYPDWVTLTNYLERPLHEVLLKTLHLLKTVHTNSRILCMSIQK